MDLFIIESFWTVQCSSLLWLSGYECGICGHNEFSLLCLIYRLEIWGANTSWFLKTAFLSNTCCKHYLNIWYWGVGECCLQSNKWLWQFTATCQDLTHVKKKAEDSLSQDFLQPCLEIHWMTLMIFQLNFNTEAVKFLLDLLMHMCICKYKCYWLTKRQLCKV